MYVVLAHDFLIYVKKALILLVSCILLLFHVYFHTVLWGQQGGVVHPESIVCCLVCLLI